MPGKPIQHNQALLLISNALLPHDALSPPNDSAARCEQSYADRQLIAQSVLNDPVAAVVQDPAALFLWEAVLDHHVAALYHEQA